ncbi:Hypothetical predicted protein [Mytilus galloprovincialis]|uniref:Transposase Helix-turn-helix domain-containing protein n=1 Tax=Mytilus galloprovincialis TaxID=29158 RepID=A0A8B6BHP0_MYTGA|nr:Hypothetical predicted protein [Mytilus galloprovincialis]
MIERRALPKIESFVDIVLSYDNQEFRRNFRLSRGTFHRIVDHLAEKVERREYKGGRLQLTLEKHILTALWYFANTECYRPIASRFEVSDSTEIKSVDGIVSALVKNKNNSYVGQKESSCAEMKIASEHFKVYLSQITIVYNNM